MQKQFARSLDSVELIYEFTQQVFIANNITESVRFPVHLAMEELFVNMVRYYPGNCNKILLDVAAEAGKVTVTMTDYDVDRFDVTRPVNVDTNASLEARTPGGLGLHLIQNMVDKLEYHYDDRQSTIIFTKE